MSAETLLSTMSEGGQTAEEERKITVAQDDAINQNKAAFERLGLADSEFQAFRRKGVEEAKRNNGHVPDRNEWEEIRANLRRMIGQDRSSSQSASTTTNGKDASVGNGVFSENNPREHSDPKLH